jgi:hyperosmotically inducible periplasmic protein
LKQKCMAGTIALGLIVYGASFSRAVAQDTPTQDRSMKAGTDKSGKPTADNAKDNPSDRDLMQQIRKGIVDDKSLSTSAHNVKVIAQHGKITLRGPVNSEDEKQSIEKIAAGVAGAGNVTNNITVKAAREKKNQ